MKAKDISKWGKIAAIVWVVVAYILNAIFGWGLHIRDIIFVGLFVMGVVSPIDLSIWLDKIAALRKEMKG